MRRLSVSPAIVTGSSHRRALPVPQSSRPLASMRRVGVSVLERHITSGIGELAGRVHEHRLPVRQAPEPDPGAREVHFEVFAGGAARGTERASGFSGALGMGSDTAWLQKSMWTLARVTPCGPAALIRSGIGCPVRRSRCGRMICLFWVCPERGLYINSEPTRNDHQKDGPVVARSASLRRSSGQCGTARTHAASGPARLLLPPRRRALPCRVAGVRHRRRSRLTHVHGPARRCGRPETRRDGPAANPTSATRSAFHLISSDFDRRPSCKGLVSLMGALGKRL